MSQNGDSLNKETDVAASGTQTQPSSSVDDTTSHEIDRSKVSGNCSSDDVNISDSDNVNDFMDHGQDHVIPTATDNVETGTHCTTTTSSSSQVCISGCAVSTISSGPAVNPVRSKPVDVLFAPAVTVSSSTSSWSLKVDKKLPSTSSSFGVSNRGMAPLFIELPSSTRSVLESANNAYETQSNDDKKQKHKLVNYNPVELPIIKPFTDGF